jgi:hypothetical protein
MPEFPDLAPLNAWLERRCMEMWHEISHGGFLASIADVWATEQVALMPLPCAFDGFVEHSKRVSPTCLINFERTRYSVPASFANRPVSLRVYSYQRSTPLNVVQVANVSQIDGNVLLALGYMYHITPESMRNVRLVEDARVASSAIAQ